MTVIIEFLVEATLLVFLICVAIAATALVVSQCFLSRLPTDEEVDDLRNGRPRYATLFGSYRLKPEDPQPRYLALGHGPDGERPLMGSDDDRTWRRLDLSDADRVFIERRRLDMAEINLLTRIPGK